MKQGFKLFTIRKENIIYFSDSEALLTDAGIKNLSVILFGRKYFKVVNNKITLNAGVHFIPIDSVCGDYRLDSQVEYTSNDFKALCVVRTYTDKDYDVISAEIRDTMSSWGYSPAEDMYLDNSIRFTPIGHSLKFIK